MATTAAPELSRQERRHPSQERPHLSPQELAVRYDVPLASIRRWRCTGYGPKGFVVGRYVRYRLSDVLAWEQAQVDA